MFFGHYRHPCEMTTYGHHQMMIAHPYYPLAFLAVTVLFAILLIGLLILVDRTRLTPVVQARHTTSNNYLLQQFVMEAIRRYSMLNINN